MKKNKIKGLGGWLIIPMVNLFLMITLSLSDIDAIISLNMNGLGIFILLDCVLIFLCGLALFLLFNKISTAPNWAIAAFWFNALYAFSVPYIASSIGFVMRQDYYYVNSFLFAIIWTMYFIKSERVKNTFVE